MKLIELLIENKNIVLDEIFDDKKGLGAVPNNLNVDYLGLRVEMLPKTFLSLAKKSDTLKSKEFIKNHILNGGKIGHPFLIIKVPYEWEENDFTNIPKVVGHEGRNRVSAILDIFGNLPIEVHLFFMGFRNRDINENWINTMKHEGIVSENGEVIREAFDVI